MRKAPELLLFLGSGATQTEQTWDVVIRTHWSCNPSGLPFSDTTNYSTPKVGSISTTFLIQATWEASRTSNRQTLLNFISVNNSQDSVGAARNPSLGGELFRASGTCRAPFHLLARSWMSGMFHRNRAQGAKVDGANNGSLTCQDDVLSTTLKKVRGNQTRD